MGEIAPHQRFAPGEADLGNAQRYSYPGNSLQLLIAQDVFVWQKRHTRRRHAIEAAKIATVGYGEAKIVNAALIGVDEGVF
jgi:hypothetical protein